MIYNKRGLSTVVTTLIIILLVLVAIGIIWIVIRGVIERSGEQIDINTKCVTTNLEVASGTCSVADNTCDVAINKAGGYALDGVKGVVTDGTDTTDTEDVPGDIQVSSTISIPIAGGLNALVAGNDYTIKVSGYFINDKSEAITCPQVNELVITAVA